MSFPTLLFEVFIISLSGVMMPGPLTAVTIGKGTKHPHAGALVALGHGIVEIPTIAVVFLGLGCLATFSLVRISISILGGILLLVMAASMLRSIHRVAVKGAHSNSSGIWAGILLSAGNPYFFIWWATAGAVLITRSREFAALGLLLLFLVHWLCDLVWCDFLSVISFRSRQFFGNRLQKVAFIVCGIVLVFFGIRFIVEGVKELISRFV